MDARGKFGEHEKCVRVARGVAESNSSFLSSASAPWATLTHFSCSPNFLRASTTRYTHSKPEQILKWKMRGFFEGRRPFPTACLGTYMEERIILSFFLKVVKIHCLVCHHSHSLLFNLQKLWYSWSLVVRDSSFCEFLELAAPRLWTEFLLWHAADEGCFSRTRCAESWRLPLLCCALYDTNVKGKLAFQIFAHPTFL